MRSWREGRLCAGRMRGTASGLTGAGGGTIECGRGGAAEVRPGAGGGSGAVWGLPVLALARRETFPLASPRLLPAGWDRVGRVKQFE